MTEGATCRAVKRDGQRCSNRPQIAGFCRVHYPKAESQSETNRQSAFREGIKTVGEVIAVTGGAIKLIETIVKVWQSLPFGPGPRMPSDYEYLADEIGPSYPQLPEKYSPFNAGPSTVDWARARAIYDRSRAALETATADTASANNLLSVSQEIESSITVLLDAMQRPFREMLLERLGSGADDA